MAKIITMAVTTLTQTKQMPHTEIEFRLEIIVNFGMSHMPRLRQCSPILFALFYSAIMCFCLI